MFFLKKSPHPLSATPKKDIKNLGYQWYHITDVDIGLQSDRV